MTKQLKKEQDEVASLKSQLTKSGQTYKTELEHAASERTRQENELQKIKGTADEAEQRRILAEGLARQFQARIDAWTVEFRNVQENMHSKFPFFGILLRSDL